MQNIKKIILIVFSCIAILILVACNGSSNKVKGEIVELIGLRTTITVDVTLTDENQKVTSGTFCASIYDKDDALINTITFSDTTYVKQSKEFTSLKTDTTYTIKLFATYNSKKHTLDKKEVSTSTIGTEENPVSIKNADDFLQIKRDQTGYFKIENNIDFDGQAITPLFTESTPFKGHIIGNGKTIKNFKLESSTSYHGVFGYLAAGSSINNINFQDITVTISRATDTYFGVLVGLNKGTIENVSVNNVEITFTTNGSGKMYIGTLIGMNTDQGKINNCQVTSSKITLTARNYAYVGGFVGYNSLPTATSSKRTSITNSHAEVDIEIKHSLSTSYDIELCIGGFVGVNQTTIEACTSISKIVTNTSKSTSTSKVYYLLVGGFIGNCNSTALVTGCAAVADIEVNSQDLLSANVGGFIGKLSTTQSMIKNCILIGKNSKVVVNITTQLKTTEEDNDEDTEDKEETVIESYDLTASALIASKYIDRFKTTYLLGAIETEFTEQNVVIAPNIIADISTLTLSDVVLAFINANK